jgi:hypothetical protein
MVILLMALQSTHILQVPFFLGTKITGMAQGLRLSRTYLWSKSSWTCRWTPLVSSDWSYMLHDLAMSLPGSSRFDVQFLSKVAVPRVS